MPTRSGMCSRLCHWWKSSRASGNRSCQMQTAPSPARLIAGPQAIELETLCRSLGFRERFVVLGHDLLVRLLGARGAQDHALGRVGNDLMKGRLDDRIVHLPATRLDEIRPGALVASLR